MLQRHEVIGSKSYSAPPPTTAEDTGGFQPQQKIEMHASREVIRLADIRFRAFWSRAVAYNLSRHQAMRRPLIETSDFFVLAFATCTRSVPQLGRRL
jgi:hypothetical protein